MDHREHAFNQRTAVTRGVVTAVDDSGCVQTVDVQSHAGVQRAGVEVHHPFGFSSAPPAHGSVVVLIGNGADPSDMIALPAACPGARLGGLQLGEVAIHAVDGTRVYIKLNGIVEIVAAAQVQITAPNCTITCTGSITLASDVTLTGKIAIAGDASVGGNLTVAGDITAGGTISP